MSYSVSEVLNFYFNKNNTKVTNSINLGFIFHRLINLYLIMKNNFDLNYFLNNNNLNENEKYILINLFYKTLNFIDNKIDWKLMVTEQNINYNNIYGKPDIIFEYKYFNYNNYFFLLSQYYCNIFSGIINYNILEESAIQNSNNKKKIILIDWKCYFNQNIFRHCKNKMNYLLNNNIFYTNYNKFLIQMNIYKYILENNYNFIVSEMYIYLLNPKTFGFQLIPILTLKKDFIIFLIDNFIKYKTNNEF